MARKARELGAGYEATLVAVTRSKQPRWHMKHMEDFAETLTSTW